MLDPNSWLLREVWVPSQLYIPVVGAEFMAKWCLNLSNPVQNIFSYLPDV